MNFQSAMEKAAEVISQYGNPGSALVAILGREVADTIPAAEFAKLCKGVLAVRRKLNDQKKREKIAAQQAARPVVSAAETVRRAEEAKVQAAKELENLIALANCWLAQPCRQTAAHESLRKSIQTRLAGLIASDLRHVIVECLAHKLLFRAQKAKRATSPKRSISRGASRSRYLDVHWRGENLRLRISDHDLPTTAERSFHHTAGRRSYDRQLVIERPLSPVAALRQLAEVIA